MSASSEPRKPLGTLRIVALLTLLWSIAVPIAVDGQEVSAEITPTALDTWGVYESVTSGTLTDRIDSEVMAIEQIGDLVYVGGKFTEVRRSSTSTPVDQPFLAAFDVDTGAYVASFAPDLDGPVYALQASPDGSRLFVGGEFGDVAGVANTQALVALDPLDGSVDTSWKSQLKRDGRAVVYALDLDDTWLYVGGTFSAVGGAEGVPQISVARAVKLSLADATPDSSWNPLVSGGGVWGIAVSPDGATVYLAGYFSSVNLENGTQGFVGVDNSTGDTIRTGRISHNNANRPFYHDVVAVNGLVFVAGMEHLVYVLDAGDLSELNVHSTGGTNNAGFQMGGDYQDLEVVGDRVYASCHCRNEHFADGDIFAYLNGDRSEIYTRRDPIRFVAAYSALDGDYLPSFQLDISGSSGVWAIHVADDGCLWIGGDTTRATRADGSNQARGGFTRHCDETYVVDTERPSTPRGLSVQPTVDGASLSWDASTDNVAVDHYEVWRTDDSTALGEVVARPTGTTYEDAGLPAGTYWYRLKAVDTSGNTSWRSGRVAVDVGSSNDTTRPSTVRSMTVALGAGDEVVIAWDAATDDVGVIGYDVYRATSAAGPFDLLARADGTVYTDTGVAADTYWYYVRAVDGAGNVGWRNGSRSIVVPGAGDVERPSTPRGLQVDGVGADSVELSWTPSTDDVGVTEYVIFDSANLELARSTTASATVTGLAAGEQSFYVKATDAAGNLSWRSNLQTVTVG